jgi:hypothetical protein
MKEMTIRNKLTIAGTVMALAMMTGAAGFVTSQTTVAFAQTTDDGTIAVETTTGDAYVEPETKGKTKTQAKAKGTATPLEICEAEERSKARTAKFLADGTPEQFGSEEPFTFDSSVC